MTDIQLATVQPSQAWHLELEFLTLSPWLIHREKNILKKPSLMAWSSICLWQPDLVNRESGREEIKKSTSKDLPSKHKQTQRCVLCDFLRWDGASSEGSYWWPIRLWLQSSNAPDCLQPNHQVTALLHGVPSNKHPRNLSSASNMVPSTLLHAAKERWQNGRYGQTEDLR